MQIKPTEEIKEIKTRIENELTAIAENFQVKPFDPQHVGGVMSQLLTCVAAEAYSSPEDYDIKVVASHDDDGGPTVIVTPGNLQTFILMQGHEIPPTAAQLAGSTGWIGSTGNYFVENGKYFFSPVLTAERVTFTSQLDPEILKEILRTDEAEIIKKHQDGEDRNAAVGIVCNNATAFVHLKNRFAERDDLKGYRLLLIDDERKAQRLANVMDFAVLYTRGESLTDNARRAYAMLERYQVKIRLAFFQIVNYTE